MTLLTSQKCSKSSVRDKRWSLSISFCMAWYRLKMLKICKTEVRRHLMVIDHDIAMQVASMRLPLRRMQSLQMTHLRQRLVIQRITTRTLTNLRTRNKRNSDHMSSFAAKSLCCPMPTYQWFSIRSLSLCLTRVVCMRRLILWSQESTSITWLKFSSESHQYEFQTSIDITRLPYKCSLMVRWVTKIR